MSVRINRQLHKFKNQTLVRRITLNDYGYNPPTFVDCPETSEEIISDRVVISLLVPTYIYRRQTQM